MRGELEMLKFKVNKDVLNSNSPKKIEQEIKRYKKSSK